MRVALVAVWVALVAGVEGRRKSAKHKLAQRHVSPADSERGPTNAGAGAAPAEADLYSEEELEAMNARQLKTILQEMDLDVKGKKQTLIERLLAAGATRPSISDGFAENVLEHTSAEDARRGQRYMGLASASVDKIGSRLDGKGDYQSLSAQDVTATRRLAWSAKHSVSAALELLPPSSKHWETAARLFLRAVNLLDAVGWSDDVYGAPMRFDELLLILSEASEFDGLHAVRDRLRAEMTGEQADNLERWIAHAPPRSSLPRLPVKRPPVHSRSNAYGVVSAGEDSSRDLGDPLLFSTLRLFSTPVSSINMLDVGIFSRDFNSRLNAAATKSYARFLEDPRASKAARGKPDDTLSNLFYSWQGGAYAKGSALALSDDDMSTLKATAKRVCARWVASVGARPQSSEELIQSSQLQMWLASYEQGASHVNHVHDGSICSGVYWSAAATNASPIVFSDPRGLSPMETIANDNDDEPEAPFHNQYSWHPADGDMVLFPSWLVHKVLPNPKGVQRTAWVFNLAGTSESWLRTAA